MILQFRPAKHFGEGDERWFCDILLSAESKKHFRPLMVFAFFHLAAAKRCPWVMVVVVMMERKRHLQQLSYLLTPPTRHFFLHKALKIYGQMGEQSGGKSLTRDSRSVTLLWKFFMASFKLIERFKKITLCFLNHQQFNGGLVAFSELVLSCETICKVKIIKIMQTSSKLSTCMQLIWRSETWNKR